MSEGIPLSSEFCGEDPNYKGLDCTQCGIYQGSQYPIICSEIYKKPLVDPVLCQVTLKNFAEICKCNAIEM